ncbi:MAG: MerR family transcriptional regulator [Rudanella sp.]|nr:MerR family transcriptional regulator [Rudanella sp.]
MQNIGKLYFTIREVAAQFKVNASKLRFYEEHFPSLKPKKNKAGDRIYTQADIDHIRKIFDLVQTKGLKLPAARDYLHNKDGRNDTIRQSIEKLEKLKTFLVELRDGL